MTWLKKNLLPLGNIIAIIALIWTIHSDTASRQEQNQTLVATKQIASADYVLKLSDEIGGPEYTRISSTIESGSSKTHLLGYGFTDTDLENYMGKFETLGDLVDQGVISPEMAYQEFYYDTIKTWCNDDVKKEVTADRSLDKGDRSKEIYWQGFQNLANYVMQKDAENCSYYDNQ